jgi:hypothetical protein
VFTGYLLETPGFRFLGKGEWHCGVLHLIHPWFSRVSPLHAGIAVLWFFFSWHAMLVPVYERRKSSAFSPPDDGNLGDPEKNMSLTGLDCKVPKKPKTVDMLFEELSTFLF